MALTPEEQVRILIGDVPSSPFYPIFTSEEIEFFLDVNGNNIMQSAKMAAIAASMQLAGWNTRETTGDITVWNDLSKQYLKALENLINDKSPGNLPNGLMPYASGISWEDFCANNANPDNIRSPLTKIKMCDTPIISGTFNIDKSCGC